MPNLENLRKQAKQYLHWHRDGHYPVAAQIRAVLPRFGHLDDAQIMRAAFRLTDAQELVARQSGFDGWQALKAGAKSMPPKSDPTPIKPRLSSLAAMLFVADIDASCEFYCRKFGFTVDFVYGEPAFYGQISRDGVALALRMICEPVFVGDVRTREHLLSASITVDTMVEIKQLFLEFAAAGLTFHQTLKTQPWGARDFVVLDLDGNLLHFAGPGEDGGADNKPIRA